MKKLFVTIFGVALLTTMALGQQLTQTVRGTVLDADSKLPLIGAEVIVLDSDPLIGAITDENGTFRLMNVVLGRINLQLSYLGYEGKTINNIVVNSGKEVVLDVDMQEAAVKMNEVVVTANPEKGAALNDMALLSARAVSPEQTNRYAGGFNDPSRILSNFAGVTSTQDGSNDIIIRGNSPKYIQWRLEGIEITNPNHFADQSAVSGSVSTLNNNLLATSDFYTGAFSAAYGDVLSGVYDVKLRNGNNEKFESVFGFGLLGTELTLEGPFKKGYGGSFLVNYRYSTASVISDLGLIDAVSGILKFQDATFKIVLPSKKWGTFSLFGLGGNSSFLLEDITPALWETPGNRGLITEISEDFEKKAYLSNLGLNHTLSLNQNSFIKTSISYANEGISDQVFESTLIKIKDDDGEILRDSLVNSVLNYNSDITKITYRAAITYNTKLNTRNKIQIGARYALFDYKNKQSQFLTNENERFTLIDFDENIGTFRTFISWKNILNDDISFVLGLHNMNVLFNDRYTIEPRLAFEWKLNPKSAFRAGYGLHSNMEAVHNYFAKVQQANGTIIEPNKDLGLLKAHHFVMGFEHRLHTNLLAKVELYYQHLYDLPVENNDTSFYATINEGLDLKFVDLVNKGTGRNYGIEITLERFFNKHYYYLINASLYESKYTSLEGIERNTPYNGNYLVNFLFGKEFVGLGKSKNQTFGINGKIFFGGGRKIIPLLRDAEGHLAVNPSAGTFWDYDKAYEHAIEDVYQIILSANYKWNKPKATHEIFLNLDNITNNKGKISEFYDESEPNSTGYLTQFGFFPNVLYRVYF